MIGSELAQTVRRQIDAFADANAGGAGERERLGRPVVSAAEFLLEPPVVVREKRPGQIQRSRRKVLATDEARREGMAVGGQVVEQAAEAQQIIAAGFVRQRRILFRQPAEPAEQVGITTQLREPAHVRVSVLRIGEETASHAAVVGDGVAPQSQGEGLDVGIEDLGEALWGRAHGFSGGNSRVRLATARAYSRQTSWGASWT
ncbi:MAG: hypothetical protein GY953_32285 [bacterium]|nr:hypothetical protein [bacterium]